MRARLDPETPAPQRDAHAVRERITAPDARDLRSPRAAQYVEGLSPRGGAR